jgi:hypothetical protein
MRALVAGLIGNLILCAIPAYAQVATVGKGWLLVSAGSVTSVPSEVISGGHSIRGSYSGSNPYTPFLYSDPTFIRFVPNGTYTISVSYRIITAGSGFEFGFFSASVGSAGPFVPTQVISGGAGLRGTATLSSTLLNHADYQFGFKIVTTGTIAIDDIRITNSAGTLVASENAEGPTLASGPLKFQLSDGTTIVPDADAKVRSVAVNDLNGDGYPETVLTLTAPRPSTTPIAPLVIESSARMRLATRDFFPSGAPTVNHSPLTFFSDLNGDGLQDMLFAEAGSDSPPWAGANIGVALNLGSGKYRNVSPLVPADVQTMRSYSLAAGDIDGDGRIEIILPDQNGGLNPALLRWNGNGFDVRRNWIDRSLWSFPTQLYQNTWMLSADLDKDGRQDLLVSGAAGYNTPNMRVLFNSPGGFTAAGLAQLPDGLYGHDSVPTPGVTQSADVGPVIAADFNNDGLPDIFSMHEQVLTYLPGIFSDTNEPGYQDVRANGGTIYADSAFQILMNQDGQRFADLTSASTERSFARITYYALIPFDMNNDGFLDVVAPYQTKLYAGVAEQWGTTLFLNDGTGAFQAVDGADFLPTVTTSNGQRWNLGSFVPSVVNSARTEGIVVESTGGCGGLGFCAAKGLNLYKVVASGALGTGPNFVDPETLGVPGFNEFYYLRHNPDAAAAVAAGQYKTGLEHYLAVGAARGYRSHAVICASCPLPFGSVDTPVEGASNLSGSIAIGGWALSPSGITAVRILRAPIAGEGSQPIPVGTAVRLAGARPDVAAAYPTHLGKERAGWGYLLLTNVLPNQGNGTYTLYVYADDADGRSALIGTRTITVNNAAATRPFGAIDTPAQGEIVSGTYVNFGWVVTPKPKMIPKDGSTITVYVDGVPLGHPTYDQYRADIAGLFPGLDNANGAVGAFVIDTTKLANGIHTISWLVTDSAGVSEGIGSRFFTVQNPR